MKKTICVLLAAVLCLIPAGCTAAPPPEAAADGSVWEDSWVTVGGVVGVDTPEGMDHRENNEALAVNGMYYAAWSIGEGRPYTNEDGEDAELYDAQIYLLLDEHKSAQDAGNTLTRWMELAQRQYAVAQTAEESHNGQDFTVITYSFDSDTNPYARGASAFGICGDYAVSVELACQEDFDGDAAQLLAGFLDHCHYAAP